MVGPSMSMMSLPIIRGTLLFLAVTPPLPPHLRAWGCSNLEGAVLLRVEVISASGEKGV